MPTPKTFWHHGSKRWFLKPYGDHKKYDEQHRQKRHSWRTKRHSRDDEDDATTNGQDAT